MSAHPGSLPGGRPAALAGVPDRVLDLAAALRRSSVPVSTSATLDALSAAAVIDLARREQLREALAATMLSSGGQRAVFDALFDIFFPPRVDGPLATWDADGDGASGAPLPPPPRDVGDFIRELMERVLAGDDAGLRRLAQQAVELFGRVDNPDGSAGWFAYRVHRAVNVAGVLRRLVDENGVAEQDPLEQRLARDEFEARLRRYREEVDAEVRRRLAEQRGADDVARRVVRPLPEDVDFFRVTADDEADMRRAVRSLARKLAARLAVKRRRGRHGRLDVRRTLRRALATGGVPADPAFKPRTAHRAELVVLCDVSGSVASFARFTLMLCHSLQGQLGRVRSFAFVDAVDEVTSLFSEGDFGDAMRRLTTEAQVVWLDGHSDYGNAFEQFLSCYADAITPRTTLLVLGDARNNYRASRAEVLGELRRRARRAYWLNPEPAASWGSGDSIAVQYARHVDDMVECRTLRQLSAFVERIA